MVINLTGQANTKDVFIFSSILYSIGTGYIPLLSMNFASKQPSGSWSGTFSGNWNTGLDDQGSNGYFWSSTVNSATNARNLNFDTSIVNPGNNDNNKYNGFGVRCVLP